MNFSKIKYAVEANSYESSQLWGHWIERVDWEQSLSGIGREVGTLAGIPVFLSLMIHKINGEEVLFWWCISQVVDHRMICDWLKENLPMLEISVDAGNFHRIVHATK